MAQTAAAHLGDLYTAGRHHRGDHKGGLIAHAAGGVLIHRDAAHIGMQHIARARHGQGQIGRFARIHAV